MHNERLLKSKMTLYGDTYESLGNRLSLTRQSISKKISGESDWTQTEMSLIKKRYKLSDEEFAQIFTKEVSANESV